MCVCVLCRLCLMVQKTVKNKQSKKVGGASLSRHQSGTAADIQQYSVSIYAFADSVICQCRPLFVSAGYKKIIFFSFFLFFFF